MRRMIGSQGQKAAWAVAVGVLVFLALALAGALYDKYRPVGRRRFLIPASFTGKVYLVHGKRPSWLDAVRARAPETLSVPEDGILVAWNPRPTRYADTYFDMSVNGTMTALVDDPAGSIENTLANQQDHRRIVFNAGSELVNLAQCTVDVETFYVGSPAALLAFEEDDRLDRFLSAHPEVCPAQNP